MTARPVICVGTLFVKLTATIGINCCLTNAMNDGSVNFQMGSSIPALLAEEWLVQPRTMLPNAFEIFLIEQANRTVRRTLDDTLRMIRTKLHTYHIVSNQRRKDESRSPDSRSLHQTFLKRLEAIINSWSVPISYILDTTMTKYHAEIAFCIHYLVERQSILNGSATLAESMYGLRRSNINKEGKLRNELLHKELLALLSSLIPYLFTRVKDMVIPQQRSQRVMLQATKYMISIHKAANLAFFFAYMTGRTHYTGAVNYLLRQVIRRVTQTELRAPQTSTTITGKLERYKDHTQRLLYLVAIFSYTLQFWSWYRHAFPHKIPDPPQNHTLQSKCPICDRLVMTDPTVLDTTGLVYCHACITRYVRIHRMCPVTKVPNPRWRRLHEPV